MGTPTTAGDHDGLKVIIDGRTWQWVLAKSCWFPTDPQAYESAQAIDGQNWLYHPEIGDWIRPENFPDPDGSGRPTGSVIGVVRGDGSAVVADRADDHDRPGGDP